MPTKNPYGNMMIADLPEPETVHAEELLELIDNKSIDLICVLGPTASGKTRYAVELARELNRLRAAREENIGPDRDGAEILSGDSRQVYRWTERTYRIISSTSWMRGRSSTCINISGRSSGRTRTSAAVAASLYCAEVQDFTSKQRPADIRYLMFRRVRS